MSYFKAKMHQIRFRLGLRPRPRGGSLQLHACRGNGGSELKLLIPESRYIEQASGHFTSHFHIHWICGVSKLLHRSENSVDHSHNCCKRRTKLVETAY